MCPLNNQHAAAANSNSKQQQKQHFLFGQQLSWLGTLHCLGSERCKAMSGWMTKKDLAAFAEAREKVKKMYSHAKSAKRVTKKEQPQSRKTKKVTQARKTKKEQPQTRKSKRVTTAVAEAAKEALKAKWKAETKRGIAAVAEAAKKAMKAMKAKTKSMKTKRRITAATTASKDRMSERPRWRAGLLQRPGSAGDQVHEDNEGGDGADSDEVVAEAGKKAVKAKTRSEKEALKAKAAREDAKEALKAKWKAETKRGRAAVAGRTGLVAPAPRVYWRFGVRHSE